MYSKKVTMCDTFKEIGHILILNCVTNQEVAITRSANATEL